MIKLSVAGTIATATVGIVLGLSTPPAAAQDTTLRLFVSNGMKGSIVDAAKALIAFLAGPKVTPVLKAKGIDRSRP